MGRNLREHLLSVVGRDLRACFADFCGYEKLSPDQERHIELLQSKSMVVAMGGSGVGKSFVQGVAAAIAVATTVGSRAMFGAPKLEQAEKLSWREMKEAINRSVDHSRLYLWSIGVRHFFARDDEVYSHPYLSKIAEKKSPIPARLSGSPIGVNEWYPGGKTKNPSWFAVCTALSDRNNAASIKGMLHGERVLVVLDEIEGVPEEVRNVLLASTQQENSHFWLSFNPVNRFNAAGRLWFSLSDDCRVHYSALRAAEWQAKNNLSIPGMPTLKSIAERWKGKENDPLYYTYVLGEFPPETIADVVVPESWSARVVGLLSEPTERDKKSFVIGVDTGWGGASETVFCACLGRFVLPLRVFPGLCDVPHTAGLVQQFIDDIARQYGLNPADALVAIDVIGTGGAGVHDLLRERGVKVLAIRGGSSTLDWSDYGGSYAVPQDYSNVITWGWWLVRERIRRTVEILDSNGDIDNIEISLAADPTVQKLREQLARKFRIRGDRKIELKSKDAIKSEGGVSPDRADALAMAMLALELVGVSDSFHWGVVTV